jgi:hypothetical protein
MPAESAFANLAEEIGADNALRLIAFAGDRPTLYAPEHYRPGHILEHVLGEDGFLRLIAARGGETISLPGVAMAPARRLGIVHRGLRRGLPLAAIAAEAGCTPRRVKQIRGMIMPDSA